MSHTITPPPQDPAAELDEQALAWFVRERAGLSSAERAQLQQWQAQSARHAQALAAWQQEWAGLDALPAAGLAHLRAQLALDLARAPRRPEAPEAAAAAATAAATTASPEASQAQGRARRAGHRLRARVGAAALALSLAVVGVCTWQAAQPEQALYSRSFSTKRGQQLAIALPDGSQMRLDTASRADVTLYRGLREVRMPQGQAEFQVAGDSSRPFDVIAGPVRVTVLGTRFAVRYTPADAADGRVQVAVEEGHVRVRSAAASGAASVELSAGQQVRSDASGRLGAVTQVSGEGIAGWRDGRLSFNDATLAEVLAEFERYAPTGLVIGDPRAAALRVTGTFDPRRPQTLHRVLPEVLPVRLQPRGEQLEIRLAGS